ncbi:MAG: signal transduction histidine kinase/ligand-binding sensor domain-containing protein [Candidatus Pelagisphaera sp.]|jgi:signal transduction histidine kinase/ligand-binding sensor domain-containing protein
MWLSRKKNPEKLDLRMLFVAFLLLAFCLKISAQSYDLKLREPVSAEGYKIRESKALYQDETGFMYIGTNLGLFVFDGYSYKVYKHDYDRLNSLSHNRINCIFKDDEGMLWVGTRLGLDQFDRNSETFSRKRDESSIGNGSGFSEVRSIAQSDPGNLWLGTERGLIRYEKASGEFKNYSLGREVGISSLYLDRLGIVWGGTDGNGLFAYDPVEDRFDWYVYDENDPQSLPSNSVGPILEDAAGRLWVGTQASLMSNLDQGAGGLCSFDRETKSFRRFTGSVNSLDGLRENAVTAMVQDFSGNLWIGMRSGDLYQFDSETAAVSYFPERDPKATHVSSLLIDYSGALWVARQYSTVLVSTVRSEYFQHWSNDQNEAGSLSPGPVGTLFEDSQRVLWVGTVDHGLNRHDSATDTFEKFLPNTRISALHEDRQGDFWVASYENGLTRFNRETNKVEKTYTYNDKGERDLAFERIRSIWEDTQGALWVGHMNGLAFLDRTADVWRSFEYDEEIRGDHMVKCSYVDNEGRQWIGTNGGALVVDTKSGELQRLAHKPNDEESLSSDEIRFFHEDSRGNLWIGTEKGLNRRGREDQGFRRYYVEDGLPNDMLFGILEDASGVLWVMALDAISRYDPDRDTFTNFDESSGLLNHHFEVNAYFQNQDGLLYFGGTEGIDAFYPVDARLDTKPPKVAFTSINTPHDSITSWNELKGMRSFELVPGENDVGLQFSVLDFVNPSKNVYRYRLRGLEDAWSEWTTFHFASYTLLPIGDYAFEVQGSNGRGNWNELGANIGFSVLPLFWQTVWFKLVAIGLLLATIIGIHKLITENIRKRNAALNIAVSEAVSANEQLVLLAKEAESANIAKSQFLANMSHEIRTPLNGIMGMLSLVTTSELSENNREYCDVASSSAETLLILLNDILDVSRIETGCVELDSCEFSLKELTSEAIELAKIKAMGKRLEFNLDYDPNLPACFMGDSERLRQVLLNLLVNAIKFTSEGSIWLRLIGTDLREESAEVRIEVGDTGIGIPNDKRSQIFEAFSQVDGSSTRNYGGAGLGLSICKEIIELMDGEIGVESQEGLGSTFWFSVCLAFPEKRVGEVLSGFHVEGSLALDEGLASGSVLIAEDIIVNQLVLVNILEKLGFETVCSEDGESCLSTYNAGSFDMIFMDCEMPGIDGYEATRRLREQGEDVPIIAVTARAMLGDREKCLSAGMDDYVSKPLVVTDIERIVKRWGKSGKT